MDLRLRIVPDSALRSVCHPVTCFGATLARTAAAMQDLMLVHRGVGLAAPQVGLRERLVVVLVEDAPVVIANPVIVFGRGASSMEEGCLSCPGIVVRVGRTALVVVEGQALDGRPLSFRFDRVAAHCIQHEIDHLDGRLIIDHGMPVPADRNGIVPEVYRSGCAASWDAEKRVMP